MREEATPHSSKYELRGIAKENLHTEDVEKMGQFLRKYENLSTLEANQAFFAPLEQDILSGKVFPAIRNQEAHFYYRGYRLFSWNKKIKTNESFYAGTYDGIKGKIDDHIKAKNRAYKERPILSGLYYMCAPKAEKEFLLLDIEAGLPGFQSEMETLTHTQIDLVFLTRQGKLVFVEAKEFSDDRISQKKNGTIEVDLQLTKYKKLIAYYEDAFIHQYQNQLLFLSRFFDLQGFPPPTAVDKDPRLLIYNYKPILETDFPGNYAQKKAGIAYLIEKYGTSSILRIDKQQMDLACTRQ